MNNKISLVTISLMVVLSGCGGGESGNAGGGTVIEPQISASDKIKNASDYSTLQLQEAATTLVESRYTGLKTDAKMNITIAQDIFINLFSDPLGELPDISSAFATEEGTQDINVEQMCNNAGTVSYKGNIDDAGIGKVTIVFDQCVQYGDEGPVNGVIAAAITENTSNNYAIELYVDNLTWSNYRGDSYDLTGQGRIFSEFKPDTYYFEQSVEQNILASINGSQQILFDTTVFTTSDVGAYDVEGTVYLGESGKVTLSSSELSGYEPYFHDGKLIFSANKVAELNFDEDYIRYLEDSNGDGTSDIGTYISNKGELLSSDLSQKTLVALSDMSLPPEVGAPYISYSSNTTMPIEAEVSYIDDSDSTPEQLSYSFRWYINGDIVEGETSHILPPYTAVYKDDVRVAVVVSDGVNLIEGPTSFITLEDAPSHIETSNLPADINAGDTLEFSVSVVDPDMLENELPSQLIEAPEGASIDNDSNVTWTIPNDFIFPMQTFDFVFGMKNESGELISQQAKSISVNANVNHPIARSGVNVPLSNNSMWVVDIDSDGKNEVLATDNSNRLFTLSFEGGKYQQQWQYPYSLPSEGAIRQIITHDIDSDSAQEIIIITTYGVSVLDGLNAMAKPLLTTEGSIFSAAVADVNNDGDLELAYLLSDSYYSSSANKLVVVSFSDPTNPLFTTAISDAKRMAFAQVDSDSNLELVINTGLVYDALTWENEWLSSSRFSNGTITTGDFDDDGIAEIVGANNDGDIIIFSAQSKSQLASFESDDVCDLYAGNIDNDLSDELIVGDCQWGNITGYDFIDMQATQKWQLDIGSYGLSSLTVGDSDNDGQQELHWGAGVQHSGANIFIGADISRSGIATTKEFVSSPQLSSYHAAGWSAVHGAEESGVFYIADTQDIDYNSGSRIATVDELGSFSLSETLLSSWGQNKYAVTSDFNNDGYGDIFIPATANNDGPFSVLRLHDNAIMWELKSSNYSSASLIKAADMNNDSFEDLAYIDDRSLSLLDIENEKIIAKHNFDNWIVDFAISAQANPMVAVSHYNEIQLTRKDSSIFSELSTVEQSCSRVEFFNYDTDAEQELVCLNIDSYDPSGSLSELIIFDVVNDKLVETAVLGSKRRIVDLTIDPVSSNNQDFFLVVEIPELRASGHTATHAIQKYSKDGFSIWTSPSFTGSFHANGLKVKHSAEKGYQLLFATYSAMYKVH